MLLLHVAGIINYCVFREILGIDKIGGVFFDPLPWDPIMFMPRSKTWKDSEQKQVKVRIVSTYDNVL
jgi:hypothetical protein